MHHTVDVAGKTNKQPELGDVLDFAFDFRALGVRFCKHFPWVALGLFQAQRHAALGTIDFQNHDFDFLAGRYDFAWVNVLFRPGHFGNVNQTFNTWLQLNKGTVVRDVGHAARVSGFQWILGSNQIPWIFLQLLHTKADTVGLFVDLDDLHLDRLTDCQDFRWVVHATPRHVCDVQQAVYAA